MTRKEIKTVMDFLEKGNEASCILGAEIAENSEKYSADALDWMEGLTNAVDMSDNLKTEMMENLMPEVLASTYCMDLVAEDGKTHKVELTDEQIISTGCPRCGKTHTMTFGDFLEIMKDGCLYGTSVYCSKCSAKRLHNEQKKTDSIAQEIEDYISNNYQEEQETQDNILQIIPSPNNLFAAFEGANGQSYQDPVMCLALIEHLDGLGVACQRVEPMVHDVADGKIKLAKDIYGYACMAHLSAEKMKELDIIE